MIISLRHKFIYIRTRKTASTAIHLALEQCLGPEDIVIRKREVIDLSAVARGGAELPTEPIPSHISASEMHALIREDFWNDCFKFTSELHPYEKAVSFAYFRYGRHDRIVKKGHRPLSENFEEALDRIVKEGKYSTFPTYAISGVPVVSDFIRQERLDEDLRRIGKRIGISIPTPQQEKTTTRQDRRPASDILTEKQKRMIYDICRPEFDLLGYEP